MYHQSWRFSVENGQVQVTPLTTVYYVNALTGNDANDGLSPETAFATIQRAIDTTQDGDTVVVAPGT